MQLKSKKVRIILGIFIILICCFIIKPYVSEAGSACGFCGGASSVGRDGCRMVCADCGAIHGESHNYTGGNCSVASTCSRCGVVGSINSNIHSFGSTCTVVHCGGSVCSYCGTHQGTCTGGHNSNYCSHCGETYCNRGSCSHYCPHNSSGSCSDVHCQGITWCTLCARTNPHSHGPHVYTETCPKAHCKDAICKYCKEHQTTCGGDHELKWEKDTEDEIQTHTLECSRQNCDYVDVTETHTSEWKSGDVNHTSSCKWCDIVFEHKPVWDTKQQTATALHPCVWGEGCLGTHEPKWGEYYKTGSNSVRDDNNSEHTRNCGYIGDKGDKCQVTEVNHNTSEAPTWGEWYWGDLDYCERDCQVVGCDLHYILPHEFKEFAQKDINDNNEELYKHWKICTRCDSNQKLVDEVHEDDGYGRCWKCKQVLWKILIEDDNGAWKEDITDETLDELSAKEAFRIAKQQEVIKIVEVVEDDNGMSKTQYIQTISGPETLFADGEGRIEIKQNGTYTFTTGRGGTASFVIDNISTEVLIDTILTPEVSTTGQVKITVRSNISEASFNKKIYIKEGTSDINIAEVETKGANPISIELNVTKNGTYYFRAEDTVGNERDIVVVVDNIINGQATVAISNDVFINGYIFTDVLVNPNGKWNLTKSAADKITAKVYKVGSTSGEELGNNNIKTIGVMDMQLNEVSKQGDYYLPGAYYIKLALGGNIFKEKGTYIIDLESVKLPSENNTTISLPGKNRVIVEVQDLRDLT